MKLCTAAIEFHQAEQLMTDTQLARRAGVSRQTMCVVKKCGSCKPATAGKIAQALGVPVAEIIRKED